MSLEAEEEYQEECEEGEASGGNAALLSGSGEFMAGPYNYRDVNDQVFEELVLDATVVEATKLMWVNLVQAIGREAVGEALYATVYDAAPTLQPLFRTPRAVLAQRFQMGINTLITSLHDPPAFKNLVETLGFQHMDIEVTTPRVITWRDAVVSLLQAEMGPLFTKKTMIGFCTMWNYIGGAYIYIRTTYAERMKILVKSWAQANHRRSDDEAEDHEVEEAEENAEAGENILVISPDADEQAAAQHENKKGGRWTWNGAGSNKNGSGSRGNRRESNHASSSDGRSTPQGGAVVPKNFQEMFTFNAAVMGLSSRAWMHEVLASFDAMVSNITNAHRFQEECEVLSLRLSKHKGSMELSEFKAVMLASLRSLVKEWGAMHEVSWTWLWENAERMLKKLVGRPGAQEAALAEFLRSVDQEHLHHAREQVYVTFFRLCPSGEDLFKASTTRLHFIVDRLVQMTLEMYRQPKQLCEDLSALGLRHVGYGIPTDMFGPFVTSCVQVVGALTNNESARESFAWSLGLISRILMRVVSEGSTIVMRAINANSGAQLQRAVACAPRGKRALWVLNVQVGTQSISPLLWAIETGAMDAAKAILDDLLTIRGDRERYYYGMDLLFQRHPDIIKLLTADAPQLVPVLLDGLIWRSRIAENGQRRVNYYIRHLVADEDGLFSPAIGWVTETADPKVVCHPVMIMVTDMIWRRVAMSTFLYARAWFLFTLAVFVVSQSIIHQMTHDHINQLGVDGSSYEEGGALGWQVAMLLCRVFIYTCSLGQWLFHHGKKIHGAVRTSSFTTTGWLKYPTYLQNWQDAASLALTLCLTLMLILEPFLRCLGVQTDMGVVNEACKEGEHVHEAYQVISAIAVVLYFIILTDMSVISTNVSAFVLVCIRLLSELALFLCALIFLALAFACAANSLHQSHERFNGIHLAMFTLIRASFAMMNPIVYTEVFEIPTLAVAVFAYIIAIIVFLLNLFIAQVVCAYSSSYQDMLGFARLNRGRVVHETMPSVPKRRWFDFVDSLRFDVRVEFGEGDLGVAGGVQVLEPASVHPTTIDAVRRYAGPTSPLAPWPADEASVAAGKSSTDRFERMEKILQKTLKRIDPSSNVGGGMNSSNGVSTLAFGSSMSSDESGADGSQ